jgi:hypothetical protein
MRGRFLVKREDRLELLIFCGLHITANRPSKAVRLKSHSRTRVLFQTEKTLFRQAFRVNRRVYSAKSKIGVNFSKDIYDAIAQGDAPLKKRLARLTAIFSPGPVTTVGILLCGSSRAGEKAAAKDSA